MVRDAESHADEDRRLRDLADAKNAAESLIYQTEKSLREHGEKIDESARGSIQSAITDLRSSLEGENADDIRQKSHTLTEASYKLAEAVYANAQAHASASDDGGTSSTSGPGTSESPEDEVITDAEIVEDEGATRS